MKKGITFILLLAGFFYGSAQSTGNYKIKFLEVNKNNSDNGVAILDNNKLIFTSADEQVKPSRRNYNIRIQNQKEVQKFFKLIGSSNPKNIVRYKHFIKKGYIPLKENLNKEIINFKGKIPFKCSFS